MDATIRLSKKLEFGPTGFYRMIVRDPSIKWAAVQLCLAAVFAEALFMKDTADDSGSR